MAFIQINNGLRDLSDEEVAAIAEEKATANAYMLNIENRNARNQLLADSDWTQFNDSPLTDEAKTSWATYRTALRDLPTHENWPSLADDDWPTKP